MFLGPIFNLLHIDMTKSNEAPPTPLESNVINVLYGMSASIENCLKLVYLSITKNTQNNVLKNQEK